MAWSGILLGLDPPEWAVLSGTDRPSESCFRMMWDDQFCDRWFFKLVTKAKDTKNVFADELQIVVIKILGHIPDFLREAYEALRHQCIHSVRGTYFRVVARGQCLDFSGLKGFTQFSGHLTMMFGSKDKCAKQSKQCQQQSLAKMKVGT